MIFYLLCVLCPLPASRIHLHRGCVLRARSQALCECHPVRHAARISTSYKGVNACYWLLLHHIASLCHATDPTDDANHFFLVVRVRMSCEAKFGKAAHPSSGRSGDRPPGASWFNLRQSFDLCSSHVTLHMICFFNRMLYMMPLMQSAKPFAICRANCLVRCNLVMYLYSNS